jgi:hypothetical protein
MGEARSKELGYREAFGSYLHVPGERVCLQGAGVVEQEEQ